MGDKTGDLTPEELNRLIQRGRDAANVLDIHDPVTPEQKQAEIDQMNKGNVEPMVRRMMQDILSQLPGKRHVDEEEMKSLTEFIKQEVLPTMAARAQNNKEEENKEHK